MILHLAGEGVKESFRSVGQLNSCKRGEYLVGCEGGMGRTGTIASTTSTCSASVSAVVPARFELKVSTLLVTKSIASSRSYQAHIRNCETAGAGGVDCA